MAVEEKILSDEDKEQMLKESPSNKEDVEFGKIYTVSSVKIMRSDKEFFEETARTILDVKKCVQKVKPEKEKIKQKAEEIKRKIEAAKKAQKNQAAANQEALRALSGRPTKVSQNSAKNEKSNQKQQPAKQNGDRAGIENLEKDLNYCKGAEAFIDNCGKEAEAGLVKLEGIMASGKVESWSVLVDFEVAPLPSERENDKNKEGENNKDKDDKDKDNNRKQDGKNADKNMDNDGAAIPEKSLKDKISAKRGINHSGHQSSKENSSKANESVHHSEGQINPNLLASYLRNKNKSY